MLGDQSRRRSPIATKEAPIQHGRPRQRRERTEQHQPQLPPPGRHREQDLRLKISITNGNQRRRWAQPRPRHLPVPTPPRNLPVVVMVPPTMDSMMIRPSPTTTSMSTVITRPRALRSRLQTPLLPRARLLGPRRRHPVPATTKPNSVRHVPPIPPSHPPKAAWSRSNRTASRS
jgi:hypothetical protein